jgi:hypothetical protein
VRTLQLALVIATPLAVYSGTYAVMSAALAPPSSHIPVTLKRTGPAPLPPGAQTSGAFYGLTGLHRSGETLGYIDRYSGPWPVFFKYHGCPVTKRGAFRLTVYRARPRVALHGPGLGVWGPGAWHLFSRTLVDRKTSDSATYTYPGTPSTYYLYRVVIPDGRGCASWSLGTATN